MRRISSAFLFSVAAFCTAFFIGSLGQAYGGPVTSPEEHLGRPVGVDFELADWKEESSYFIRLGEESENVITRRVGSTTEGRDFLISIISDTANLANLDQLKKFARIIADPRSRSGEEIESAIENGKVFLFVSGAMHATEAAGSQFLMEFGYTLATSDDEPWVSARNDTIVVLYVTNPDGVDHVTNWYRKTVGTPYEGSGLLKLYQYYAGHDNNRDWFMLTQNETRIVSELLYTEWFPQVYWDVHQQGSKRERFFVPPYRDPLNPNLDPNIITAIDALGSRGLADMTREGFTGISTGVSYDMWWNGGNRNVPVRHNMVGILTEAASVNMASPMFIPRGELSNPRGLAGGYAPSNQFPNPWPGGWWRLRDIIDYEMAFGSSLLGSLAREPETWLRNAVGASRRSIDRGLESAPKAWIIPSDNRDPDAVRRFLDILLRTGVEIHVAKDAIEADGRGYAAGSIVILRSQPYGQHVKDLMEVQRYPEGAPPYDVSGWTVPFLFGIRRSEVNARLYGEALRRVDNVDDAVRMFGGDERVVNPKGIVSQHPVWSSHHSSAWKRVALELANGTPVQLVTEGLNEGLFATGIDPRQSEIVEGIEGMPRIGVYSPWSGSMDEGWLRYVLDTNEIPYITVKNESLRAGNLGDFLDVLVMPSLRSQLLDSGRMAGTIPEAYAGGLSPEGANAIEEFVRGGGRLVTLGSSSQWAIDLLELPLIDVTRGEGADDFSCPGSVLRAIPQDGDVMTAGLGPAMAVFFSGSSAYRAMTPSEMEGKYGQAVESIAKGEPNVLLRYAPTRVLMSGWIKSPETIEGRMAWVEVSYGDGEVEVFGFRPQYRGWSQASFGLLFRSILLP